MTRVYGSLVALCASFLMCANASAVELGSGFDLDLELTAVSDYRDRGISQTLGDPAIQGGAMLSSPIGAYVGAWASSVDFGEGSDTRMEQDIYAGWYIPVTDDLLLDIGWLKYMFPKNNEMNSSMYYFGAMYKGFEFSFQYSDDREGDQSGSATYLAYTYDINDSTRAYARYGINDTKDESLFSASGNTRSKYDDWEIALEKDYWGATWKASYIDTDMSEAECMNFTGHDDLCSATVVASVSKHF
ncbi:TorF family putative porin [Pseudomonas sp. Gutcm_11s]|uniref:TorF family putative porin n=1 Tax=Pseudomonas sp. Gutcm_11s TaxID=3026088 RepID=UPI0023607C01|nr:TorF family putative porin [Pseudomonas sp. Gutcm_11s]MDD0841455.1 TorF family putative porin [Pseudomonas sp. Gutcm_11s]